eukprot:12734141-Ditylum_brightwellii.AAC.1
MDVDGMEISTVVLSLADQSDSLSIVMGVSVVMCDDGVSVASSSLRGAVFALGFSFASSTLSAMNEKSKLNYTSGIRASDNSHDIDPLSQPVEP